MHSAIFTGVALSVVTLWRRLSVLTLKVTDDLWVHSAYEKACVGELACYRFIVVSSTFYEDACFAIKLLEKFVR